MTFLKQYFLRFSIFFAALVATSAFAGGDHGSTIATARLVQPNTSIAGVIGTAGDADMFRIDIPSFGFAQFYTTGTTDTVGQLYNASGTFLVENDDGTDPPNFLFSGTIDPGTYYVRVRHFNATRTGAYVFNAYYVPIFDVAPNSRTNGSIGANQSVLYRIALPTAGTLTVSTEGFTDTFGTLYAQGSGTSTELAAANDGGAGTNFLISRSVPAGNYAVIVRGNFTNTSGVFSFVSAFSADAAPPPPPPPPLPPQAPANDHGTSNATATFIQPNGSMAGVLTVPAEPDYFKVNVFSSGTLTLSSTGVASFGQLYNGDGVSLQFNEGVTTANPNFLITRAVTPGTYFLRVTLAGISTSGNYSVVSRFVSSNTQVQGTVDSLLRVYNPTVRAHLYTTDTNEYKVLGERGWARDGEIAKTLRAGAVVPGNAVIPLYRLYSPALGKHLFTTDLNEYTVLATRGWSQDGITTYLLGSASASPSLVTKALSRLYNSRLQQHLFTTDANEVSVLTTNAGWQFENVVGHVVQ